ncbi:hypothetical protein [Streptomyces parvus]|uniref:PASTA domain-containing protein n=1 Tax=Streptomyces parvus TaxID=66428 RepID=A0A5D4JJE3_9ACTN|nr:hypothetical protein [Streptomyces parvus]TYR65402.1 hypothetical protein FY004_06355 [Streptomyces parvus]
MKSARYVAGVVFPALLMVAVSGCVDGGNQTPSPESDGAERNKNVIRDLKGEELLAVMKETADAGKGFSLRDATNLERYIYHGRANRYVACFGKEAPKLQAVDLYAVPEGEKCPDELGSVAPAPRIPDLVGQPVEKSFLELLLTGYPPERIKVFKVENPAVPVSPEPLAKWRVCAQQPNPNAKFDASDRAKIHVATKCS